MEYTIFYWQFYDVHPTEGYNRYAWTDSKRLFDNPEDFTLYNGKNKDVRINAVNLLVLPLVNGVPGMSPSLVVPNKFDS